MMGCFECSTRFCHLQSIGQCWTTVSLSKLATLKTWTTWCTTSLLQLCGCGTTDNQQNTPVELASGNVHLITTIKSWEEHLSEANKEGKIVIANFSTSWSGPCREIAPAYIECAHRYSSTAFLTVDIDALPEFSSSWDIKATPTFFFLKDGRQVDKLVGSNKEMLWKKIGAIADSDHAK